MDLPRAFCCPVCEWTYEPPALPSALNASTLAGVFGVGVMERIAEHQRSERTEQELAAHMRMHSPVEFVRRIRGLERDVAVLRDELNRARER